MTTATATAQDAALAGPAAAFPASKYAVQTTQSGIVYFEVKAWKKDKGTTIHYLRRLVGHPGDWLRTKPTHAQQTWLLEQLELQTPAALSLLFSQVFTCCSRCESPLSDEVSVATGLGPVCRKAFGL